MKSDNKGKKSYNLDDYSQESHDYVSRTIREKSALIRYYTGIKISESVYRHGDAASHLFCVMFLTNAELVSEIMKDSKIESLKSLTLYEYQPELIMLAAKEMEDNPNRSELFAYFNVGVTKGFIPKGRLIRIPCELLEFLEKGYTELSISQAEYKNIIANLLIEIERAICRAKESEELTH